MRRPRRRCPGIACVPTACRLEETGSGSIGTDREPGDVSDVGGGRLRNPGLPRRSSRPVPYSPSRKTIVAEDVTDEETEIYEDLARRAGIVARRLLAERGLAYLDDLDAEEARDLLRLAWREAAETRFDGLDLNKLHAEIDAMVASLDMTDLAPGATKPSFH